MDVITAIHGRRSIGPKHLAEPGPGLSEITRMVEAALAAPDHGDLRPWRVIMIAGTAREAFGDLLVQARRARDAEAGPEILSRERERGAHPPVTLAVCVQLRDQAEIPATEQWIAVGAAIENLLLVAHAMGYGAKLLSGGKVRDPMVRDALGVRRGEEIAAFIALGTPSREPAPRIPVPITSVLIPWIPPRRQPAGAPT